MKQQIAHRKEHFLFVLYTKKTSPSGRVLGTKLREKGEIASKVDVFHGDAKRLMELSYRFGRVPAFVINMGDPNTHSIPKGVGCVVNHPERIINSSNKRGARISFRDKKVSSPELWLSANEIPANKFPVVGRTTNHSQAKGFWYCKTRNETQKAVRSGATHFLRFIPNTREFRVHVFASTHNKKERKSSDYISIKVSEKVFEGKKKTSTTDIIKNHKNGWVFKYTGNSLSNSLRTRLRELAKNAMACLELDWGAVDIMMDKSGTMYVLEINSSPRLTDEHSDTAEKYADAVCYLVGAKKRATPKPVVPRRTTASHIRPRPKATIKKKSIKKKTDYLLTLQRALRRSNI